MTGYRDPEERFADWVDGEMEPRDRERFEAEMAANPGLRTRAEQYRDAVESVRDALAEPWEDEQDGLSGTQLADRILEAAATAQLRAAAPRRWVPALFSALAAAGLIAGFLFLEGFEPGRSGPSSERVVDNPPPGPSPKASASKNAKGGDGDLQAAQLEMFEKAADDENRSEVDQLPEGAARLDQTKSGGAKKLGSTKDGAPGGRGIQMRRANDVGKAGDSASTKQTQSRGFRGKMDDFFLGLRSATQADSAASSPVAKAPTPSQRLKQAQQSDTWGSLSADTKRVAELLDRDADVERYRKALLGRQAPGTVVAPRGAPDEPQTPGAAARGVATVTVGYPLVVVTLGGDPAPRTKAEAQDKSPELESAATKSTDPRSSDSSSVVRFATPDLSVLGNGVDVYFAQQRATTPAPMLFSYFNGNLDGFTAMASNSMPPESYSVSLPGLDAHLADNGLVLPRQQMDNRAFIVRGGVDQVSGLLGNLSRWATDNEAGLVVHELGAHLVAGATRAPIVGEDLRATIGADRKNRKAMARVPERGRGGRARAEGAPAGPTSPGPAAPAGPKPAAPQAAGGQQVTGGVNAGLPTTGGSAGGGGGSVARSQSQGLGGNYRGPGDVTPPAGIEPPRDNLVGPGASGPQPAQTGAGWTDLAGRQMQVVVVFQRAKAVAERPATEEQKAGAPATRRPKK